MYADGRLHGPNAVCPTCGMTDAKIAHVIKPTTRLVLAASRAIAVGLLVAGLAMLWRALTGRGSFLRFAGCVFLALKLPYAMFTLQTKCLVHMVNKVVDEEVRAPCQQAQDAADALAVLSAALADTTLSMAGRMAYLRDELGVTVRMVGTDTAG